MTATVIDGKLMAEGIRGEVAEGVRELKARTGVTPGLAAVLVGDDPASAVYVRNKRRACDEAGMFSETIELPAETSQAELIDIVARLNADDRFHGILVQLPLPPHIEEREVILAVSPDKDVDGMHPVNSGRLLEGSPRFLPATPAGVQQMLVRSGNDPGGKHVVILGAQQHRRQAAGGAADAEGAGRERDGDGMPYGHQGHAGPGVPGGHRGGCNWPSASPDGGHGEGGGRRHRRRDQPRR